MASTLARGDSADMFRGVMASLEGDSAMEETAEASCAPGCSTSYSYSGVRLPDAEHAEQTEQTEQTKPTTHLICLA